MYKKILMYVVYILICNQAAWAQNQVESKKMKFYSINNVGLLNGSKGGAAALQSILGFSFHHTFAGIGAGIDYYRFRSVPLFVDLRQEFGKGNRSVFVYGDVGYNFDWLSDKNILEGSFYPSSDFKGGTYYDAGLGYKISFKNNDALLVSAGYSYKQVSDEVEAVQYCPFVGPCFQGKQTYKYSLPRLILKVGYRF